MISPVSLALADLKLDGNIIPNQWFSVIGEVNRYKKFRADLLAINIMAELVYWYRPRIDRDEKTGEEKLVQKFHADKYQMSYGYIEKKFGSAKKGAKDACDLLVSLKAITREFRTITSKKGVKCNNVMFLEPVTEWVKANTLPPNRDTGGISPTGRQATPQQGGTNTKTTEETSSTLADAKGGKTSELNSQLTAACEYILKQTGCTLKDDDRWTRIWWYNAVKSDGIENLKIAIRNFCANKANKDLGQWDWISFFKLQAKRANYLPKAEIKPEPKVEQTPEVHWLDSTEYTDEKKTEILVKGILRGNILPARWVEWEKKIYEHLTRENYSTSQISEILAEYKRKEGAKTPSARMAS